MLALSALLVQAQPLRELETQSDIEKDPLTVKAQLQPSMAGPREQGEVSS
jgi:hypothetical protein